MKVTVATRDFRLDTIKAIMILGIVVEHSLIVYGYPRSHELFWALMISWLMPMFTLISGYLYKQRKLKELLSKYLYPMFLFSAVNFAIGFLFYDKYHERINIFGYAMWYLWALFWFQIITPLLLKRFNILIIIILSFLAMAIYVILPLPKTLAMIAQKLQINRLFGFYPFYLLGIMLNNKGLLETKKKILWQSILVVSMVLYIGVCYVVKGFAYKSGFYLAPSSSLMTVSQFLISYAFIMTICVGLIKSIPNTENVISKYGGRTLNVYLLHMMVVFPLCYGIFRDFDYNLVNVVLNSLVACVLCLLFFTERCDGLMKKLLTKERWGVVITVYLITLLLVNSSLLSKIFING